MLSLGMLSLMLLGGAAGEEDDTFAEIKVFPEWTAPKDGESPWSGSLSAGITTTEGNSDTQAVHFLFDAQRRSEDDRLTFNSYANFGKADSSSNTALQRNVENYGAGAKYDYFLEEKLYALANASYQSDDIAGLDARYIGGFGAGYQVKEEKDLKWGLEAGLSYVDEDLDGGMSEEYMAARAASALAWQVTETTKFEQVAEVLPSLEDSDDFYMKWDNRLKLKISESWVAQAQYIYEYDNSPAAGSGRSDQKIVFSLGWSFGS